ncbi:phenylacetate--CoA ligase family protein [Candidatus Cryosericum hinesii]|jgi:phenylacetate-CoA ligase|uniref:Phenylacetate--CoA ligase family protein n=3 Tax=Candidatus Cryosericum hinesii TaxID=2290915 RepID=A0A398DA53_9BACT|nr:phenylacetate--CoA ligase family protein [Candidatus Cryosericum hinesii]RIE11886.1 phenylacetate--CoA ligase family protein [Candidatus Cryosericum hinesii]RIE11955.1 phenylacetate--CoA ligase family protein [Candidatus Cryosericum hinesii]
MISLWYVIDHVRNGAMWRDLRQMESSQDLSWREIAAPRLEELLTWSQLHVPAHRALEHSHSLDILDLLETLPIMKREDLINDPGKYTSDVLPRSVHWKCTGGSTGVLLHVLQDSRYGAANSAGSYLFFKWVGWKPTDRIQKIWGSYAEVLGDHPTVKRRLLNWLYGQPQLDANALRAGDFDRYVDVIDRTRPEIILSYVNAAESLAEYINISGRRLSYTPRGVVTAAGTLFPDWRRNIERAFGCPVFNRYASDEAGCIACARGADALYVNPSTHIVEVVDADGQRIAHGTGRILVTVLNNLSMPLIRYDTGDYATIDSAESLYPQHGWQRLESVDGRELTMLRGPDGSRFSPLLFTHLIDVVQNKGFISQYQIVQRGLEKYTIRLKLWPGLSPEEPRIRLSLDGFRHDMLAVLGSATVIEFAFVDQVEAFPSGKVPFCIVRFDEEPAHASAHD